MITVSDKSRLALKALVELSRHPAATPVPIVELAGARNIPLHIVEQLFGGLRRAGILQSQRGVKGGYSFRRPPSEVSVSAVIAAVDGEPELGTLADGPIDEVLRDATQAFQQALEAITVAELAQRESQSRAPMFHI